MSQGNSDEMPQEVDFTGGVRGKYLARYQRWAGLTTAVGPLQLNVLSTGDLSVPKIVTAVLHLSRVHALGAPETVSRRA